MKPLRQCGYIHIIVLILLLCFYDVYNNATWFSQHNYAVVGGPPPPPPPTRDLMPTTISLSSMREHQSYLNNIDTIINNTSTISFGDNNNTITTRSKDSCHVNTGFAARRHWLGILDGDENEDGSEDSSGDGDEDGGYILLHHVRRAGGTTICGLLANNPKNELKTNCRITRSAYRDFERLGIYNLTMLENHMNNNYHHHRRRVVAVEGLQLPTWFLQQATESKRWTIITSIRHPVDRHVSISRTKCKNKNNNNDNETTLKKNSDDNEWIDRCLNTTTNGNGMSIMRPKEPLPISNTMIRMFSGNERLQNYTESVTIQDYQQAIYNLETYYEIILITEWIPEMASPIFKYWLGIEGGGSSSSSSSSNTRRGYNGHHFKEASTIGKKQAIQHYITSSSPTYLLQNHTTILNRLNTEHSFDIDLYNHFKKREKWRAFNCFLFRDTNIEY